MIRDYSKNLPDLVKIRFSELYEQDKKLYIQYLVCAYIIEFCGMKSYALNAEDLFRVSNSDEWENNFSVIMKNNKEVYIHPTIEVWRNFLSETFVEEWFNYRIQELLKTISRGYILQAAENASKISDEDEKAMKMIQKLQQQAEKNRLENQQTIIQFYGAPLKYGRPNSNDIITNEDGGENEE